MSSVNMFSGLVDEEISSTEFQTKDQEQILHDPIAAAISICLECEKPTTSRCRICFAWWCDKCISETTCFGSKLTDFDILDLEIEKIEEEPEMSFTNLIYAIHNATSIKDTGNSEGGLLKV